MEALSPHDEAETIILKFSSQAAKTETILNFIGFVVDQDPGPILALQPNAEPMGKAFSVTRLAPMIRDTPSLTAKFGPQKGRDTASTMTEKQFPGGGLAIASAASPASLASRPIRYVMADEINRWEATKDGDALRLAIKRTLSFWNRKILITSTPTVENVGISYEYERSLQHEWQFRCPSCEESQTPRFKHFVFERGADGEPVDIGYVCEACGEVHPEKTEHRLKARGHWTIVNSYSSKRKGFFFNQFASPFTTWRATIGEFLQTKDDPEKLRTTINTAFAEEWRGSGEQLEWEALRARRMVYPPSDAGIAVPAAVDHLLLLVDTQDTWLDYEVIGLNGRRQTWGVEKGQLYGATDQAAVWQQLDELYERDWPTEGGGELGIYALGIDIRGHRQKIVKDWLYRRRARRVHGLAGMGKGVKAQISTVKAKLDDGGRRRVKIYNVRVDDFKRRAQDYMGRVDVDEWGACFWPRLPDGNDIAGYDQEYFEQLCAERQETKVVKGFEERDFVKTRVRNEAFDLRHMLYALIEISKPPMLERVAIDPPASGGNESSTRAAPTAAGDWMQGGRGALRQSDWMNRR